MDSNFGVYLREARLRKKLTQQDVADALGITRSTVAMWETSKALPRLPVLFRLAALYGCFVGDLINVHDAAETEAG